MIQIRGTFVILFLVSCIVTVSCFSPSSFGVKSSVEGRLPTFLYVATDPTSSAAKEVSQSPTPEKYSKKQDDESNKQVNGAKQDKTDEKEEPLLASRTLYEVLGASPDATREELKRKYVTLARATHPDAQVGKSQEELEASDVLFTEVAAAWRILSNRKERQRYDRSLKAKAFTESIEQMAGEAAEQVAQSASKVLETVAMPFIRKTTTTTMASVNAAVKEVKETSESGKKVDLGTALGSAVKAGKKIGRSIDRYELLKKSRELEQTALGETERSMAIKGELSNVMNKRLSLSLRIPNSALTSAEALRILDGLNTIDTVTLMETIRGKHPIVHDIQCLEEVETEFNEKKQQQEAANQEFQETRDDLIEADLKAKEAVEVELEARRVLEEAQRQVIATRQTLLDWNRLYAAAEASQRRANNEVERMSLSLERKQEKVRTALRKKEEDVLDVQVDSYKNSLETLGISDLKRLRKQEASLTAESERLDDRAKRLRSRARKLKLRSEELKAEEEAKGNAVSEEGA